jgi:glycosyltransferase involved in cell wall biosynthesis
MFLNSESQNANSSAANTTSHKIKVCHVAATAEGATWMFEQLRELRDRFGCEVCAVVSADRGALIDKLRSENIRYHVAKFAAGPASLRDLLQMPLAALALARFFRRERFDVVQSHIFITMRTVRPAAWLADVPVRISMIAGPYHLEAPTSSWIERATAWMETILIPSCQKTLDLCREMRMPKQRLSQVIYYGPDETNFDPLKITPADIRGEFGWPPDTPIISMVAYFYHRLSSGRWVPRGLWNRGIKGHEDLIKAAVVVLREFPNAKFLLVGSAWDAGGQTYLGEVKDLVQNLGLESSVIFLGHRTDANSILRASNVAVQASVTENLGGTIEALLMECPTVATRVGGMVDSIRDGETGVLVNASDPADLARGIIQLLRNPTRAAALSRAGRELMLNGFTLPHTATALSTLYDELVARASRYRRHHNLFVSVGRMFLSVPIFLYLANRLYLVDMFPIHVARLRAFPLRLLYGAYHLVRRRNSTRLAAGSFSARKR